MSLFHYQKLLHKRTLSPGPFIRYQTYKKYLKKEFDGTCVYCRMPDTLSEEKSYAVEHYKPKNKFPHLECVYSNLFYSCCDCNSHKGTFWPSEQQNKSGIFIPNPCEYVMHDHMRSQADGRIKENSFAGQWTIETLLLNAPQRVQKRRAYLTQKKVVDTAKDNLQKDLIELKKIEKTAEGNNLLAVKDLIADVESKLEDIETTNKFFGY